MVEVKWTEFPIVFALTKDDEFAVVNGGESKRIVARRVIGIAFTETLTTRPSAATDAGLRLRSTSGGAVNYTVNTGIHAAGEMIDFVMGGTGILSLLQGSGFTINNLDGLSLSGQHSYARLVFESSTEATLTLHTGIVPGGAPVNVTKAAAAAGSSVAFARADHKHDVTTAAGVAATVGQSNAEGSATSLARSDHTHAHAAGTPVNSTKAANAEGVAATFSRSDHKHDVTTAAGVAATVGQSSAEGSATSLARSDHTHAHAAGTPVNSTKAANAEGVAATFSRSDHKHDVTTAAAITVGASNAEGSATSLARSDHNHKITAVETTEGGGTVLTIGSIADGQLCKRVSNTVVGVAIPVYGTQLQKAKNALFTHATTTNTLIPGLTFIMTGAPAGEYEFVWDGTIKSNSTIGWRFRLRGNGSSKTEYRRVTVASTDTVSYGGSLQVTDPTGTWELEIRTESGTPTLNIEDSNFKVIRIA